MDTNKQNLYFIAIIPPEPIYSEVKEFEQLVADKYKSKEALKSPSHLSLIPPFQIDAVRESELVRFIDNFSSKQSKFELSIEGFGSFGVGVIYAAFEKIELLKKVQKELSLSFYKKFNVDKGPSYAFTPHITIAFKDLMPPMFSLAWEEFHDKLYRRKWMVHNICLLRHNGKEWQVIQKSELGNGKENELVLGF
jgi:2'-5' RNA ligase